MREMKTVLKTFAAVSGLILLIVSFLQAGSDFKTIDTAQLHALVMDNAYRLEGGRPQPFTIVDARTGEEYDEAHVLSAINIQEKDFEKARDLLPKDKTVLLVVYDNGPESGTSGKWAEKAAAAGYANIAIYSEGFPAWKKNRMPAAPLGL